MKSLRLLPLFLALAVHGSSLSEDNDSLSQHLSGGSDGRYLERPYKFIFELRKEDTFIRHCGGAQINLHWFLTAAECLDRSTNDSLRMLGLESDGIIRRVAMIWLDQKIHPEYNGETKANNIALLKGLHAISYWGALLRPIVRPRLPSTNIKLNTLRREPAVVLGWTNWPKAESLTMTNVGTSVTDELWCKLAYPLRFKKGQHLCVSGVRGSGLSQDDVGAPLVITHYDNVQELIGIATDIRPFTNVLPMPMVFTSILPYVEWIEKETKETTKVKSKSKF